MSIGTKALTALMRLQASLRGLAHDRRGVAAVEFAFVLPLLLALYFVTMEVSQAIETSKKVSRVGSMVGDLVTQQQTTTLAEIDAIMQIGEATLQPYNRSVGTIVVTAIEITDEATPNVRVAWSRKLDNGSTGPAAAIGSPTTVPDALNARGSFLIRVESQLDYKPVITWAAEAKPVLGLAAAFDDIQMGETYYLRPRHVRTLPCGDC
ncbi:MAG: hypothetical protein ABS58_07440 [Mesorhizobium sp. SCN 65-20]|nr:MAG: hypothetical protein ABS58_07440 [Mesorhizobium sp. SCN 65-20]